MKIHAKKVLLVGINSRYTHSNPAIFSLCAAASAAGFECELMEFNINGKLSEMLSAIVAAEPDLVGFSCYIWNSGQVRTLSKMLAVVLPECRIVWGGPQVSGCGERCLRELPELTWIIEGEGELAFVELLRQLDGDGDWQLVPNLYWRNDTSIVKNPQAPYLDLSELPFYYEQVPPETFEHRIIYYESSRGCPFSCAFCVSAREPVRYRDLEKVKSDLRRLADSGCRKIKFVDRTFNSSPSRSKELLEFMISIHRPRLCFHLELEPLCLTRETVDLLVTAPPGCFQAEIGVQSLCDAALRAVSRRSISATAQELIGRLLAADNIHIHLDLIAGLPYETLADFEQSFNGLYALHPHYLQVGFLKVLPGTLLAEQATELRLSYVDEPPYQVLQTAWLSYGDLTELAKVEHAVDDYYNEAIFEATLRQAVALWQQQGQSPFEFFRRLGEWDLAVDGGKSTAQKARLLLDFLTALLPGQDICWRDCLRIDLVNLRLGLPEWLQNEAESDLLRAHEDQLIELVPELAAIPKRRRLKRVCVFRLDSDIGEQRAGVYAALLADKIGIWRRPRIICLTEKNH